jgi:hypothetical protein
MLLLSKHEFQSPFGTSGLERIGSNDKGVKRQRGQLASSPFFSFLMKKGAQNDVGLERGPVAEEGGSKE